MHFLPFYKMKKLVLLLFIILIRISGYTAIPPGYYDPANGLTGLNLQAVLHNIIKNHSALSYTPGVWNAFYTTDDKPDGTVWDMYSDIPNGTPPYVYPLGTGQCSAAGVTSEGECYSREHSWPKSWFGGEVSPMYTDVFMLVPADLYVNTKRYNYPYGEVDSPTWTSMNGCKLGPSVTPGYSGTVFEPPDEYKGDFARAYFYMETRYYTEDITWPGSAMAAGSQLLPWAQGMMMQWAQDDPVSQKEIERNEAIFALQNNRNPFIDHPEYAYSIWGGSSLLYPEPSDYPTSFSAHNIYLQWTDATGNVVPDGYLVRMSSVGFEAIPDPVDGFPVDNGATEKNVPYSLQGLWFTGLNPNTNYYFKIFSYSGSGSSINYKTDGSVPQLQQSTSP
jgi:endonuclease I